MNILRSLANLRAGGMLRSGLAQLETESNALANRGRELAARREALIDRLRKHDANSRTAPLMDRSDEAMALDVEIRSLELDEKIHAINRDAFVASLDALAASLPAPKPHLKLVAKGNR